MERGSRLVRDASAAQAAKVSKLPSGAYFPRRGISVWQQRSQSELLTFEEQSVSSSHSSLNCEH